MSATGCRHEGIDRARSQEITRTVVDSLDAGAGVLTSVSLCAGLGTRPTSRPTL